jgi:hypothetical protein
MPTTPSFKELYGEKYQCPLERFEKDLFWRTLHRRGLALSALVYALHPEFFKIDFATIHQLGLATSQREFRSELADFRWQTHSNANSFKRHLYLRISGARLAMFAILLPRDSPASG